MSRPHHNLLVWQYAMSLVKSVYELMKDMPANEQYGLTAQMKRAAVSVPSNIAEGAARNTDKEFLQFLTIARGSLSELETQLMLSIDLNFISDNNTLKEIDDLFGLIQGLMNKIRSRL